MAYVRVGENESTFVSVGCGPGCPCASCRLGRYDLAEWYVPEEEDGPEPAKVGGLGLDQAAAPARMVFVPGIMGSKLVDGRDGKILWGDRRIAEWIANPGEWMNRMRQGNGIDNGGGIIAPELTRIDLPGHRLDIDPYGSAIARFQRELGPANVLIFPYDWRLTNIVSAQRLKSFVESRWVDAANNPARRGSIITHSMGGLVARWYIEQLGGHRFVSRVVTVGTPHHGSPKALEILMGLGGIGGLLSLLAPVPLMGPLAAALAPLLTALQRMLGGFASIYELMPDFNYVFPSITARTPEPVATTFNNLKVSTVLNGVLGAPAAGRSLIRGPRANELRRLNDRLKANIPLLPSMLGSQSVTYVPIAGFVHETTLALRHIAGPNFVPLASRCGDGTVPLRSAVLPGSPVIHTLFSRSAKKHSDLFHDPNVRQVCLNAVRRTPTLTTGTEASSFVAVPPSCAPLGMGSSTARFPLVLRRIPDGPREQARLGVQAFG